ncbi:DUF1134 domain-containing protein [Erythrobacter insulae]|uniref:DUF1134 domain-containing protein n=2 Tax=Erythrobacter insulae TaxID=2584124 RepID=A0A547PEV3_9SPHN|nr:DUF1134 domain-containing protein [Erythrobacter insulae]TRD12676.1 DUF1134 domain-containing protein [Erythrobacter insulae]
MLAAMIGAAVLVSAPVHAQGVETFDPDDAFETAGDAVSGQTGQADGAIDADLAAPRAPGVNTSPTVAPPLPAPGPAPVGQGVDDEAGVSEPTEFDEEFSDYGKTESPVADGAAGDPAIAAAGGSSQTYGEDDLIGAAEGVFGKGAEGVARMIEDLLRDQGEPNGYIVGREAGGAFILGARYGSGTLFHKIEGEQKVYWTGPSIGFDAGANAAKTFVLVYNLFDTEDLYKRYPAGEGQAYLIGGMHASYMRRGDIVLIPIRLGAGVRLGVNAGYMKFSKKQRWLPF